MSIFLLIFFVSITITALYLIRIGAVDLFLNLRPSIPFGFLLSLVMAFVVYKEFNAINEISKHITPYNGNMSATYTPMANIWQFESTDSKEQIELFYSNEENHKDWSVVRRLPQLTLQKGDQILTISLYKRNWGTAITYTLNEAEN